MSNLGKELSKTIQNLEKIRDSQNPPGNNILHALDKLYEQQIDLINAAINTATVEYTNAANSMKEAADKTKGAIDDLAKLEQVLDKVGDAIKKVATLLISVV